MFYLCEDVKLHHRSKLLPSETEVGLCLDSLHLNLEDIVHNGRLDNVINCAQVVLLAVSH